MKVIGIDPGYDRLGIAVLEKLPEGREQLIYSGCFETNKKQTIEERLLAIGIEIERVVKKYSPDVLGIETLFFQKNTSTAMAVAEARGIIMYAAMKHGVMVEQFNPAAVKIAITGYGRATKADILHMIPKLIRLPEAKRKDDELDAIAVAITCIAHRSTSALYQ